MSPRLDKTNHDSNPEVDFNDSNIEVESNDDTDDDEDRYADPDRMLFLKSLVPVGNSFALVRKSNGDPTFILYEGLSDDDDCVNDSERRLTRSFTRKIQGSNSLARNVSPSSGLAKKRDNNQYNGADTKKLDSNLLSQSVRPTRIKKRRGIIKVGSDDHSGKADKVVGGLAEKPSNDQDNGADTGELGSNCLSRNLRPRRNQKPSIIKKVGGDDHSGKADEVVSGLAKKHSNDQDNGADTGEVGLNCLSQNVGLRRDLNPSVVRNVSGHRRNRRGLANHDHSGKVDKWRVRRLSGLRNRMRLAKKRKNILGNGAEKETSCTIEVQRHQANGVEKEISCKMEAQDDQDYGDSNRAYGIWLRDYKRKRCDLENDNVETSSDSELEVLDKPPQCSEWKYTPLADSNVLDASMEDDDVQYVGERINLENPQFRKDLEDVLGRPYNEKEYETLWLQVNLRKPVQGYRELRGRLRAYSKDTMGKSYLDEYHDLQKTLDTFQADLPRKLNVLRGFFYYLKNMATEGIFKPWLDKSCLAIVPRTE